MPEDSRQLPRQSATPLYAEWEDIKERIRWAVESVLIENDPPNGQTEWAQEVAGQVVEATMLHLDGYEVEDIAETEVERLRDVAALLGLLPSGRDTDGRVIYLAYLIATGSKEEHVAEARAEVESLKPGWLKRAAKFREKVAAGA